MNKQFKSRKSIGLSLIVWLPLVALFLLMYRPSFTEERLLGTVILTSLWVFTFLFLGIIWFGIRYILTDSHLVIKIGPIVERKIKFSEMVSAERSYSLLAAPTTALRRLKISYGYYSVLISPKNELEFLKLLKQMNPNFQVYTLMKTSKIW